MHPGLADSLERPVFIDSQRHGNGNCAMYIDTPDGAGTQYISKHFNAHPTTLRKLLNEETRSIGKEKEFLSEALLMSH
jgi:Mg2+ and Co2+ transporter CorA